MKNVPYDDVWIIIPAYNEAKRIASVVRGLREAGFEQILVVDDGSSDATVALSRAAGTRVIRHMLNRGQGAALETGNEWARRHHAVAVVHFDGDGQFNPADIAPALETLHKEQVDVVLGSRFLGRNGDTVPLMKRRILLPIGRLVNWFITGVWLSDAHNGFRVLNRTALQTIRITHDGMAHNSEIVAILRRSSLRYAEQPVEVRYFEYGQNWRGGLRILKDWCVGLFVN